MTHDADPARAAVSTRVRRAPLGARWLLAGVGLWLSACAGAARPPVMARLDEVRASPAAAEAEKWAPQAHAHALEHQARADRALRDGDAEAAALLAERAIAAHEHAWVLARLARAERRRLDAEAELERHRSTLDALRARHQQLAAEAEALEVRAQVERSMSALPPHEASPAERQQARQRAAAALSAQARLLCVSVRLLGDEQRASPLIARLDELDRKLASGAAPKGLDAAAELRWGCSRLISDVRRQNTAPAAETSRSGSSRAGALGAGEPGPAGSAEDSSAGPPSTARVAPVPADVLLDELSAAGATPSRDDRGVSVSLRGLFGPGGQLTGAARDELQRLGRVADAHPDFPLLLVGHSASPQGDAEVERQLQIVRTALGAAGVGEPAVESVGDRQPLLPPRSPAARERNQRIELIFVAPGF